MSTKNKVIYILFYLSILYFLLWRFDIYIALLFAALYPFLDILLGALEYKKDFKELHTEHNEKLNWLFEEQLKSFNLFQKEYESKLQTFDKKDGILLENLLSENKILNLRLERIYQNLLQITGEEYKEIQNCNSLYDGVKGDIDIEITLQSEYIRRISFLINILKEKTV